MSITAKELAEKLNLSATAISMALNNRPGVSTETKNMILEAAQKYGYDFSRLSTKAGKNTLIYAISYKMHNAIMSYSPIFDELTDGLQRECHEQGYKLKIIQFYEKKDDLQSLLEDIRVSDCAGIVLIATEMSINACKDFSGLKVPVVLLDNYFDSLHFNSVLINNHQGAYIATEYLISQRMEQPGYLKSAYPLNNFDERMVGFKLAVRNNGMSFSRCVIHSLTPSLDGAFSDMMELLEQKVPLANCYFADNDLIAIGTMKALKVHGYKIPEDIAIIGFDNTSESKVVEPSLSTINIPRHYMAQVAVKRLIELIHSPVPYTTKIQISTNLVKRFSV